MTNLIKNQVTLFNQLFTIENNWENVLYVHTPFCPQKCYYCVYGSKVPSGKDEMEAFYHNVIPQHTAQYQNILEKTRFDQVAFGGGTPTIADADTLEEVYNRIPNFCGIPLKATEASPFTITGQHIHLFHKYRFSYVSLGVQTLSETLLKKQNRLIVDREKLIYICRELEQRDITVNTDLIFFLETGDIDDLTQARKDLEEIMSHIRPASITIHSNYKFPKTRLKQTAILQLIKEMMGIFPEYQCVNSLLEESDVTNDMNHGAEFRLMRKNRDFTFYMIGKIPGSFTYGCNMLCLGQYENFKPRGNFFYVSDFVDKYAFLPLLNKYYDVYLDLKKIRTKKNLYYPDYPAKASFFTHNQGKERFREILTQWGLPYYEF